MITRRCVCCSRPGPERICPACLADWRPAASRPVPGLSSPCLSLIDYDEAGRAVVMALKDGRGRALFDVVADRLLALAESAGAADRIDLVVPLPASRDGRARRGFDQSARLAARVARRLDRPWRSALRRRDRDPQVGSSRARRLDGPRLRAVGQLSGDILLIDDVVTTGGSLTAAATALAAAGATSVSAITVASVPEPETQSASDLSGPDLE